MSAPVIGLTGRRARRTPAQRRAAWRNAATILSHALTLAGLCAALWGSVEFALWALGQIDPSRLPQ